MRSLCDQYGHEYKDKNLPLVVASVVEIGREWRYVVVKGRVVAVGEYDTGIYYLLGDRDWTPPLRYTDSDRVVEGGRHVFSLTHPGDVNFYIRHVLSEASCPESNASATT